MTPTWTDKEVIIAVGKTVAALIPVILAIAGVIAWWYRRELRRLRVENGRLQKKIDTAPPPPPPDPEGQPLPEMAEHLKGMEEKVRQLLAASAEEKDNAATQSQRLIRELQGQLTAVEGDLAKHQEELRKEQRRVRRALTKDGMTWNEKVLSGFPEFKPLDPDGRRAPVLSVLNLKGGVGKTTITANLASALDGLGYRVLVLDLDLQGSLTGLFLPEARQAELFDAGRLLEDFLAASFGAEFPSLLDYTQPILPSGRSGLVPTSDSLAYEELNLTVRWLLREGSRDVRFLLRRELHLARVRNRYDIVLLDCPPLINVCCVNALAASDYLLIPVMPSRQATARVPVLLRRLLEFRDNINPQLKALGVVANRTFGAELTADEQNRLSLLEDQCRDSWGERVGRFATTIPQNKEVRAAEDENRPLTAGGDLHRVFVRLAEEVVSRVPTFCRPAGRGRGVPA